MVYWAAIALVVIAGGYLAVSFLVAVRFSAPNRQPPERTPANVGLDYHDVSFESTDGVPLAAWWIPPPDEGSSHAAVLVHGWEGDKSDMHMIETAPIYAHVGYGVLLRVATHPRRVAGRRSGAYRGRCGIHSTSAARGAEVRLTAKEFDRSDFEGVGAVCKAAHVVRSVVRAGAEQARCRPDLIDSAPELRVRLG
jgi:hypothetical protein